MDVEPPGALQTPPENKLDEEPTQSKDIWFSDGNIVIHAENTLFKVHRGVLSHHSPVFADMFAISQADAASSSEAPIVQLHDSAADVEVLLGAMYGIGHSGSRSAPFPWIASMIRMGRKYLNDVFFRNGMDRIDNEWPSQMENYRKVIKQYTWIDGYPGLTYDVLALLDDLGTEHAHPALLYAMSSTSGDSLLASVERPDGTLAALSPANRAMLLAGRLRLTQKQTEALLAWHKATRGSCQQRKTCRADEHFEALVPQASGNMFVMGWSSLDLRGLCSSCEDAGLRIVEERGGLIWGELPTYFGLSGW